MGAWCACTLRSHRWLILPTRFALRPDEQNESPFDSSIANCAERNL
jgi:hypothetical protein